MVTQSGRESCMRSKASRAVGTKVWSTAAVQSPYNFTCENLPEAGPGVRALTMNASQKQPLPCWEGLREGNRHLTAAVSRRQLTAKRSALGNVL